MKVTPRFVIITTVSAAVVAVAVFAPLAASVFQESAPASQETVVVNEAGNGGVPVLGTASTAPAVSPDKPAVVRAAVDPSLTPNVVVPGHFAGVTAIHAPGTQEAVPLPGTPRTPLVPREVRLANGEVVQAVALDATWSVPVYPAPAPAPR